MYDMFELFRRAQGGAAFDNLARAYGMTPDQMRAATAALTPAFMQGFQRQAQTSDGSQRFADLFQTETYARAFEAQAAALDPKTRDAGEDALGALFGSKEVSRAVAAQAAAASGVQAQIIRSVLPVLASILVGGFMKGLQGAQAPGAQGGVMPGPLGDILGQMFGGRPAASAAPSGQSGAGTGDPQNPFQSWIDMFGQGAQQRPGGAGGASANPMGDLMGSILSSMFGGGAQQTAPDASPRAPGGAPKEPPAKGGDIPRPTPPAAGTPFDDMVATGRELSAQNADAMNRIFDAFFSGGKEKGRG